MKPHLGLAALVSLGILAPGCEDSGGSSGPTTATDSGSTDASGGADSRPGTDSAVGACPFEGSWEMTQVICGGNDVTQDVRDAGITTMRLEVATTSEGRCQWEAINSGPTCSEVETIETPPDLVGGASLGITSCEPAGCRFNDNDAPCEVGDRAGDGVGRPGSGQVNRVIEMNGDQLTVESSPPRGLCGGFGLDTRVIFARQ